MDAIFHTSVLKIPSMVYIPILIVMGLIFGPLLGFIKHSFILLMFSFSQEQSASIGDINGLQYY